MGKWERLARVVVVAVLLLPVLAILVLPGVMQARRCGYVIAFGLGPAVADRLDVDGCREAASRELGRATGRWLWGGP